MHRRTSHKERWADRRGRGADGFTAIEMLVTMSVLLVAASIFYRTVLATKRMREINFERSMAADHARLLAEEFHSRPFADLFALYNEDPADDPGGPGTAPGNRFTVEGLAEATPSLPVGVIVFPSEMVEVEVSGGGGGTGLALPGGGGTTTVTECWLREDVVDEELGLPRDLNGDFYVDDLDHSEDYLVLPVRIVVRWQGMYGIRTFSMSTLLTEFVQ